MAGQRVKNSRQSGSYCPNQLPALLRVGRGILALQPLADDEFRPKEKNKVNYLYLALNLWLLGDNCVFFPLYPLIQAASERKTKNLTKNPTEGFPW